MKSKVKTLIGIAMHVILGVNCAIMAQTERIQYSICGNCNGTNPTMRPNIDYTIDQDSSDFGMRVAGGGTKFHRGIDYVPPSNASVIAVRGGIISSIVGTGLKSITVRHNDGSYYSYLHIFRNDIPTSPPTNNIREGAFVLHIIPSSSNNRHAILNLASGIGYCHDPIDIGKNITYNGRQFILTRNVTQGHAIAPVGDSHTGTRKYHLHISKIEAGGLGAFNSQTHSIDPWTSIITTPTTLTSRIRTRKPFVFSGNTSDHNRGTDNWGTIHLIYPNPDSTRNPLGRNVFQVEVEMENARIGSRYDRYDNVVMNADIVRLEFRSPYTKNWQTILGSDYEGYFRINPLDSFTIYPSRINNEYYYIIIRESGIVPFAYRTAGDNIPGQSGSFTAGFHPRDYFLFSDIYPRIIKESTPNPTSPVLLADTPKRARYNDGKYFFRSKVFNIHNDSITSDSVSCIIDNFKPYIEQFTASINGSAFYILERTGNEGVANMFDDGYVTNQHDQLNANISDIGVNLLNVKVRTSEMMKNLKIAHKKAGNAQFSNYLNMVQNESDSLNWEANIFGVFMQGDDLNVRIT